MGLQEIMDLTAQLEGLQPLPKDDEDEPTSPPSSPPPEENQPDSSAVGADGSLFEFQPVSAPVGASPAASWAPPVPAQSPAPWHAPPAQSAPWNASPAPWRAAASVSPKAPPAATAGATANDHSESSGQAASSMLASPPHLQPGALPPWSPQRKELAQPEHSQPRVFKMKGPPPKPPASLTGPADPAALGNWSSQQPAPRMPAALGN